MFKKFLFLASIVLFASVIYFAGASQVLSVLLSADFFLLLMAFGVIALIILLNGLRFHLLLSSIQKLKFRESFSILCFSQLVNQGMIAALGEASKGMILKKNHGVSFSKAMGVVMVERGQDLVFLALMLPFLFSLLSESSVGILLAFLAVFFVGLLMLLYLPLKYLKPFFFVPMVEKLLTGVREGMHSISRKQIAYSVVITFIAFLLGGVVNYLLLLSLSSQVDFLVVLSVSSAALLIGFASGLPGGLGSREAALIALYSSFGVAPAAVIASSVLLRVFFTLLSYVGYASTMN